MRKLTAGGAGLIILGVVWGLAFVAIKRAILELSPVNLALLRWIVASAFFLPLFPLMGRPKTAFERRDLPRLLAFAFANVTGYHLSLYYSETTISAGLASLLSSFGPILIVVLSVLFLGEKVGRNVLLGLLFAVSGTFILSFESVGFGNSTSLFGPGEAVLAAVFYALYTVLGKPLVDKYGSRPVTIWAGLLGTVTMLPLLSASFINQAESMSIDGWISVLYLSLLGTVVGYLLFFALVGRDTVSRLSVQLYLIPIISVLGGALLLSETVTVSVVVGGAMMLVAVALATGAAKH